MPFMFDEGMFCLDQSLVHFLYTFIYSFRFGFQFLPLYIYLLVIFLDLRFQTPNLILTFSDFFL